MKIFLESSIDNSYRDLILRRFFHISAIFASQGLWGFVITKGDYIFQRQFIENTCVPAKFIFKWPSGTDRTSEVFSNSHINFGQYIYNSNSKNMSHRLYFQKSKTIGHCICFWDKSWCQSTKILKDCYKFGARLVLWEGQPFQRIKIKYGLPIHVVCRKGHNSLKNGQ